MERHENKHMGKLRASVVLLGPPASGKGTVASLLQQSYGWGVVTPGDIYRKLREEDSDLGRIVRETLEKYHHCPDDLTNQIVYEAAKELLDVAKVSNESAAIQIDGYPRSFEQLEALDEHFDVMAFLHIDAPFEMLLDASIHRRYCKGCGRVFSVKNPPKIEGPNVVEIVDGEPRLVVKNGERVADVMDIKNTTRPFMVNTCLRGSGNQWQDNESCAAKGEQNWEFRWDDGEEKYRERTATFNSKTVPVIEAISTRPNYRRFQVLNNPNAMAEIEEWLKSLLGKVC